MASFMILLPRRMDLRESNPISIGSRESNPIIDAFKDRGSVHGIRITVTINEGDMNYNISPIKNTADIEKLESLDNEKTDNILMIPQRMIPGEDKNSESNEEDDYPTYNEKYKKSNSQLVEAVHKICTSLLLHTNRGNKGAVRKHNSIYEEGDNNIRITFFSSGDKDWQSFIGLLKAILDKKVGNYRQNLDKIVSPPLDVVLISAKLIFYPAYLKLSKLSKPKTDIQEPDFFYDPDDYQSVKSQIDKKELESDMDELEKYLEELKSDMDELEKYLREKKYLQEESPKFPDDYRKFCERIDEQLSELANYK